mgnify:CR=1 FL=1
MIRTLSPVAALAAFVIVATASLGRAQCTPSWLLPDGLGVDGDIHCALAWDPDGAGPLGAVLVLGGTFTRCCGVAANRLAAVDPVTRSVWPIGSGANGTVRSLAVGTGNELFVGGAFTAVDGVPATGVARYQAGVWQACGAGVSVAAGGPVTMVVRASGELVAAGRFASAGGIAVDNIARWNGSAWSALGAGLHADDTWVSVGQPGGVRELLELPAGLVAVGLFDASGGTPARSVAIWNGSTWQAVGAVASTNALLRIDGCVLAGGELWVAGATFFGSFLRSWDGVAWNDVTQPANAATLLSTAANGDVIAVANLAFGQVAVHRWRGLAWQPIGSMVAAPLTAKALAIAPLPALGNDAFVLGGSQLTHMSGVPAASLLLHDDLNGWRGSETAFVEPRPQLRIDADGEAYVFRAGAVGTTLLPGIGRWNGTGWSPLPSAPIGIDGLACDPRGGLVAATANQVFRFDGASWTSLGVGGALGVDQLAVCDDGSIFAANTETALYRWNGSWQSLGAAPAQIALHPDGRLIATGWLGALPINGRIGAYAGGTWTDLDPTTVVNGIPNAIAVLPNGDIVVGGSFSFGGRVAVLRGTTWQTLGTGLNGPVERLVVLADGTLVASGPFTAAGAVPCPGIAAWNGTAWGPLPGAPSAAIELAAHPNGDLWTITGTRELARWVSPCPATAQATASSCVNATGLARLSSSAWPVLGGTCSSEASGLPSSAIAVGVFGALVPSLPLAVLLPIADAGCDVRVSADVVVAVASTTGAARFQFVVPVAPALTGLGFAQQVVVLGLQPAGIVSASSTNSLAFVVGSRQ